MAKLNPKDPQFGIPVASRIPEKLATTLNNEAKNNNISLSKHLCTHLQNTSDYKQKITELENLLLKEKEQNKKIAGKFIIEIAEGDKEKTNELAIIYNTIFKNEKSN
jgi:hypothetical protein